MAVAVRTRYPGWNDHPVYTVYNKDQYDEVRRWLRANEVEEFMLRSGSNEYTFQIRNKHEWFVLRWG